jgi:hypothetical protein
MSPIVEMTREGIGGATTQTEGRRAGGPAKKRGERKQVGGSFFLHLYTSWPKSFAAFVLILFHQLEKEQARPASEDKVKEDLSYRRDDRK